ncbi:hypothetical protein [Ruminococcus flavefaciens]|uniref:hypothetical protein n=1 Tax=Ruminococcus flavefaciens TaxID=1265 RepID=UPI00156450CD|nr:hypothetical protein [Ruminococcus flavefaciens]
MNSPYEGKFKVSQQYTLGTHDGLDLVGIDSKEIHSCANAEVIHVGWENAANHKQGFGYYVATKDDVAGKDGVQKIRYYGFLSNGSKKKKLRLLFELQGHQQFTARFPADTPKDVILSEVLGTDVHVCPCCGKPSMRYLGRRYYLRP